MGFSWDLVRTTLSFAACLVNSIIPMFDYAASTWVRASLAEICLDYMRSPVCLLLGQVCTAGSRIFVQEGIYDQFLTKFTAVAQGLGASAGDQFAKGTLHGPQVSQVQFDVRLSSGPCPCPWSPH